RLPPALRAACRRRAAVCARAPCRRKRRDRNDLAGGGHRECRPHAASHPGRFLAGTQARGSLEGRCALSRAGSHRRRAMDELTFLGYRRADGRAGVRNHLLVLSINGLIVGAAQRVAEMIDGARLVATPYGRGQVGPDRETHFRQLVRLATHPEVGAVPGLGAHRKSAAALPSAVAAGSPVRWEVVTLDAVGEEAIQLTSLSIRVGARL